MRLFQASMLEELISHSAVLPAKGELDVVESTAMMLGSLIEMKIMLKKFTKTHSILRSYLNY